MIPPFGINIPRNHLRLTIFATALFLALAFNLHLGNLSFPQSVFAAPGINQTLSFQGRLLNDGGTVVANGTYSVVFTLYTVGSGGSGIWTETQSVTTTSGLFRVSLGSVNTLSGVNFNQDTLYLGMKVGTDLEMAPRMVLNASPYAFEAKRVSGLTVTNNGGNTLNIAANKGLTVSNTLTFTGIDSSSVNFGTGGTICYTSASCVTADSLDFSHFADALSLDASTSIALGSNTLSTSGAGGITFGHTGETSFADNVAIGTTGSSYLLDVQGATTSLLQALSTGANNAALTLGAEQTGRNVYFELIEDDTLIYQLGKSPTNYFYIYDAVNNQDAIRVEANGTVSLLPAGGDNVAIGKYSASAMLDVEGTFRAAGAVTLANYSTNGGILYTNGSGVISQLGAGTTGQCLQANTSAAPSWGTCGGAILDDSLNFDKFSDSLSLDASTSINLGAYILSTDGSGAVSFNHSGGTTFVTSVGLGIADDLSGLLRLYGDDGGVEGGQLEIHFNANYDDTSNYFAMDAYEDDIRFFREASFYEYLRLTGEGVSYFVNGEVGIGTTSLGENELTVQGFTGTNIVGVTDGTASAGIFIQNAAATYAQVQFGSTSNHDLGFFTNDQLPGLTLTTANNVGIGTADPNAKLEIVGPGVNGDTGAADLHVIATGGNGAGIRFTNTASGGGDWLLFSSNNPAGSGNGSIAFWDIINEAYRLIIDEEGNVVIGANIGTTKLDVNGLIRVRNPDGETTAPTRNNNGEFAFMRSGSTGRLYARASNNNFYFNQAGTGDYSEYFLKMNVIESFPAGIITTMDSGRVQRSAANSTVQGIVSAFGTRNNDDNQDGMRHTDPRYVNVGLLGQLPVIVSDENGAVVQGDQIGISSTIAGVGAKSQGASFARALESFTPTSCIAVSSLNAINWPTEIRNENAAQGMCWQLPNGAKIGKVMVYLATTTVNTGVQIASAPNQQLDKLLQSFTITNNEISTQHNLTVNGSLTATSGLSVTGPAEFNGPAIFKALSEFFYTVVFRNDVKFQDHVAFSTDSVGMVTIPLGQDRIRIEFEKDYESKPIVTANIVDGELSATGLIKQIEADVCEYGDTLAECQEKLRQNLLATGARYVVTDIDPTGFTILLDGPATQDYAFTWNAFAVTNVNQ